VIANAVHAHQGSQCVTKIAFNARECTSSQQQWLLLIQQSAAAFPDESKPYVGQSKELPNSVSWFSSQSNKLAGPAGKHASLHNQLELVVLFLLHVITNDMLRSL